MERVDIMKSKIIILLIMAMASMGNVKGSDMNVNNISTKTDENIGAEQGVKMIENSDILDVTSNVKRSITQDEIMQYKASDKEQKACMDFATKLLINGYEKDTNALLSPLSVISALAMTANGAKEDTLAQMEDVFGMDMNTLNKYLAKYMLSLQKIDSKTSLDIANSIWIKDKDDEGLVFNDKFLQTNINYYNADIFKSKFEENTKIAINNWVNKNTHGMIPKILDKINKDDIMYLVNALAFESEWDTIYTDDNVGDAEFTKTDGKKQMMKFMYSNEYTYISDDNAKGFMKYYEGARHSFIALLPNKNIDINQYVKSLTGDKIIKILNTKSRKKVISAIPKFTTKCNMKMNDMLINMGMNLAFDKSDANFHNIGEYVGVDMLGYNFYIGRVLHNTFIEVAEKGTKAGAATAVAVMECTSAIEEFEKVYLDRPFVYMIIDNDYNMPVFIGVFAGNE